MKEGIFCKSSYQIYQPIEIFYFIHSLLWKRNSRSCSFVSTMQILATIVYKTEKLVSKFINFFLDSFGKLAPLLVECCFVKKNSIFGLSLYSSRIQVIAFLKVFSFRLVNLFFVTNNLAYICRMQLRNWADHMTGEREYRIKRSLDKPH